MITFKSLTSNSTFQNSFLITVSKISGFLRDLVVSAYFGTQTVADAFNYATLITGNIFVLLGGLNGPFHSATVASLAELDRQDRHSQNLLLSRILVYSLAFFTILAALIGLLGQPILNYFWSGNPILNNAIFQQILYMLPVLILSGAVGICFGANCFYGRTGAPSLSPLLSSLALIAVILAGYQPLGGAVLGIGTSLGAVLQVGQQIRILHAGGFKFAWSDFIDLQPFQRLLYPALLSSTVGSLNVYVDSIFCGLLPIGSWTAILLGNRLIQLPFGVLVGGSLVSFLPRLTEHKNDLVAFRDLTEREFSNLFFMLMPLCVLLIALAIPMIELVFQRGVFDQNSTQLVGAVVLGLTFSMLTGLPRELFTRVYYALGDSETPFRVSIFAIVCNFLFDLILYKSLGVGGIALSTTLTALINSILLIHFLPADYRPRLPWLKMLLLGLLGWLVHTVTTMLYHWLKLPILSGIGAPLLDLEVLCKVSLCSLIGLGVYFLLAMPVHFVVKARQMID
ncbi:MAG: lipid II flippase MurJ [Candidatus Caenarcaniphilales bacterium]|nr:lipid II flippase MurJ [Candidatus Caenarcaniphilales bacterium]